MFPGTYALPQSIEVDIKNGTQPGANQHLESFSSVEQLLSCASLAVGQGVVSLPF